MKLALLALALSPAAHAAPCADLKSCAKVMLDTYGQHYVWDANTENTRLGTGSDVDITKDTGEITFTALLDEVGLARAPVGDGKTFRIVKSGFRREMDTPTFEASFDKNPELPNTWDWVTLRYKTKMPEETRVIEQAYRLHLPREGRIQADENAGVVLVTAPAPTVKHLFELIRGADKPLSPAAKKKLAQDDERRRNGLMMPPPPPVKKMIGN